MAAGAAIIASDLPAFLSVLGSGRYGLTFKNEDDGDLSRQIIRLGKDEKLREELRDRAKQGAKRFDWSEVGPEVMNVYQLARAEQEKVGVGSAPRSWLRFLGREES